MRGGRPAGKAPMSREARIVYVHGRPGPHPNRLRLLATIGARLVPVDPVLPWAHLAAPPRGRKYLSLLLSALAFPERRRWDLILGDEPQHLPVILRTLGRLSPEQKIVPYVGGEFAYFLATGYYGPRRTALLRWWFTRWHAYLCLGPMVAELVRRVLPLPRHPDVFSFPNFVRAERVPELIGVDAPLDAPRLLFIGHGPSGFRAFYKGLDLMADAFARARQRRPDLGWSIAGDWDPGFARDLERTAALPAGAVRWLGPVSRLGEVVSTHALYLHCARGEAWGITVMEAMLAGVPALVSEWTGTRHLVAQVDHRLVAPLDPGAIADRIVWYFELPVAERRRLGARGREIVRQGYQEAQAIPAFRETVDRLLIHLGRTDLVLPPWPAAS
jgi:glycosyltransferase involved in cell wall biosynthesis